MNKGKIDLLTVRLPPRIWLKFNTSSVVMKIPKDQQPTALYNNLSSPLYHNRRHQNPVVSDLSTSSFGKKALTNWYGGPLSQVKVARYGMELNNDKIRATTQDILQSELSMIVKYFINFYSTYFLPDYNHCNFWACYGLIKLHMYIVMFVKPEPLKPINK